MSARQVDHLLVMAEQIARNLVAWGEEEQVAAKTAEHMLKFWTPEMRQALIDPARPVELSPALRRAIDLLVPPGTQSQ